MGWDDMGWDRMGCDGMRQDRMRQGRDRMGGYRGGFGMKMVMGTGWDEKGMGWVRRDEGGGGDVMG